MNEELRLRILKILGTYDDILDKNKIITITDFSNDLVEILSASIKDLEDNSPKELTSYEIERQKNTFNNIIAIIIDFYENKLGMKCNRLAFRNTINNHPNPDKFFPFFQEYIRKLSNYLKTC